VDVLEVVVLDVLEVVVLEEVVVLALVVVVAFVVVVALTVVVVPGCLRAGRANAATAAGFSTCTAAQRGWLPAGALQARRVRTGVPIVGCVFACGAAPPTVVHTTTEARAMATATTETQSLRNFEVDTLPLPKSATVCLSALPWEHEGRSVLRPGTTEPAVFPAFRRGLSRFLVTSWRFVDERRPQVAARDARRAHRVHGVVGRERFARGLPIPDPVPG